MGCCMSRSKPPAVIIPDPAEDESCVFTIKSRGWLSSEYEVFQGSLPVDETKKWFYITREGSFWSGTSSLNLENYQRGNDPEKPQMGQVLWSANFTTPTFKQALRKPGSSAVSLGLAVGLSAATWGNDGIYVRGLSGSGPTLFINWTSARHPPRPRDVPTARRPLAPPNSCHLRSRTPDHQLTGRCLSSTTVQTMADLSSTMRKGWGFKVRLRVYACGTAVARYRQERIERTYDEGGKTRKEVSYEWRHDTREYVDSIQFQLERADTGQPIVTTDGQPALWTIQGDVNEYEANWACPLFSVQQGGTWTGPEPPVVTTPSGVDPTMALMLAHLATHNFAPKGIKEALRPKFPEHPVEGIVFGIF